MRIIATNFDAWLMMIFLVIGIAKTIMTSFDFIKIYW